MNGTPAPIMRERIRLADRRHGERFTWSYQGQPYQVGVTRTDGRCVEVFLDGHKTGSQMEAIFDDGAILISIMLQSGLTAAAIARRLSRHDPVPDGDGGMKAEPASVLGAIADFLSKLDTEAQLPQVAAEPGEGG